MSSAAASAAASSAGGAGACADGAALSVASWNIAAINNNPFEYHITYDDADYVALMDGVQDFIQSPGDRDVPLSDVLTDDMFAELCTLMRDHGWAEQVPATERIWRDQLRDRRIVSGLLKDEELGAKRLMSMPDRVTNTVNLAHDPVAGPESASRQAFRPTAINCYAGEFASLDDWWTQWTQFMFRDALPVTVKGARVEVVGAVLLLPLQRAKYPAVTEEEERVSLPLQTVCLAAFDAVLVHMLNSVAGAQQWQRLRRELSAALNLRKNARTLEILSDAYGDSDVVFLQEAAAGLVRTLADHADLSARFAALAPATSGKRDQVSLVLARRERFDTDAAQDVTQQVLEALKRNAARDSADVPVAEGDVAAFLVPLRQDGGSSVLLASFHGDTNGLATIPVVTAVLDVLEQELPADTQLLFGLDANTYEKGRPGKTQDVGQFADFVRARGLLSSWGERPDPTKYTTFNARTFLQPQLNKAASRADMAAKGDMNPKDFILFRADRARAAGDTVRDNTGRRTYVEDMVFPTLEFPSDHAVIAAEIELRGGANAEL